MAAVQNWRQMAAVQICRQMTAASHCRQRPAGRNPVPFRGFRLRIEKDKKERMPCGIKKIIC